MKTLVLESTLTYFECGLVKAEVMPTDSCLFLARTSSMSSSTLLKVRSWSIAVARRASSDARFLPHCRPSMLVIKHSENKVAESEGASRMGMEGGALASIVLGTHASVVVKRRAAIKRAS